MAQQVENRPASAEGIRFHPWVGKDPLEKEMATGSSILAWKIPWTQRKPGGLPSLGLQRVETPRAHITGREGRGLCCGSGGHALPIGPRWGCSAGFSAGARKGAELSWVRGRRPAPALDHSAGAASLQATCRRHLELSAVGGPRQAFGCVSCRLRTWELWFAGLDARPLCGPL